MHFPIPLMSVDVVSIGSCLITRLNRLLETAVIRAPIGLRTPEAI